MNAVQRSAVRTINGTLQFGPRVWHWIWETKEGRERMRRAGVLAAAAYSLFRLAGRWHWIGAVAIAVALIYAYRSAEAVDPEPELPDDPDGQDEGEQPTPEQLREALIHTVRTLAVGRGQGAHLDLVLAGWKDAGLAEPSLTLSEFRLLAEQLGVPVRSSLKVQGIVRIGIHLDDLPPLLLPVVPDLTPGAPQTPPPAVPDELLQDW